VCRVAAVIGAPLVAVALPLSATRRAMALDTYFSWGGTEIADLLKNIVNWMAIGVIVAVIGGVIYGAIMYTSSGGNPEQSKKGMDIIRNAVIALILYFAMAAILNFLVPGGSAPASGGTP